MFTRATLPAPGAFQTHVRGETTDWANALAPTDIDSYLRAWRELYSEHFALIATLLLTGLR